MIFGAIAAGGAGLRMNAPIPKQFLPLGDKPILLHTLDKMLQTQRFDALYIGIHPDWLARLQQLLDATAAYAQVTPVPGANDRGGTLLNIIAAIEARYGRDDDHLLVTHDAVRPFASAALLARVTEAAHAGAATAAIPATDTMIASNDGQTADSFPDRAGLYHVQTPQAFPLAAYRALYEQLTPAQAAATTDACGVFAHFGHPVRLIEGETSNFKITTEWDYHLAQVMAETLL